MRHSFHSDSVGVLIVPVVSGTQIHLNDQFHHLPRSGHLARVVVIRWPYEAPASHQPLRCILATTGRPLSARHSDAMDDPDSPPAPVALSPEAAEAAAVASLRAALASPPTRPAAPAGGPPVLLIAAGSFSPVTTAHVAMLGA